MDSDGIDDSDFDNYIEESKIIPQAQYVHNNNNEVDQVKSESDDSDISFNDSLDFQQQKSKIFSNISVIENELVQEILEIQNQQLPVQQVEKITLKDYQYQLFKNSVEQVDCKTEADLNNSIIYLDTGLGKTAISMMHIYYYLKKFKYSKKIIFLGATIQLVEQQCMQIRNQLCDISNQCEEKLPDIFNRYQCDKEEFDINKIYNNKQEMNKFVIPIHAEKSLIKSKDQNDDDDDDNEQQNTWTKAKWDRIKEESTIFVMIGQILLNGLRRGYIKLSEISIIIFDECHNSKSNNPFRLIKQEFYDDKRIRQKFPGSDWVKFLGLTASPVLKLNVDKILRNEIVSLNSSDFKVEILQLCKNLSSRIVYVETESKKQTSEYLQYDEDSNQKHFHITFQEEYPNLKIFFQQLIESIPTEVEDDKEKNLSFGIQILVQQIMHQVTVLSITILYQLGRYAFLKYLKTFNSAYSSVIVKYKSQRMRKNRLKDEECLMRISQVLAENIKNLETEGYGNIQDFEQNFSSKFRKLLEYLIKVNTDQNPNDTIQEIVQNIKNQNQTMMIFVTSKLVAKYMHNLIEDLKNNEDNQNIFKILKTNYVVGVSRLNQFKSNQGSVLRDKTQTVVNTISSREKFLNQADAIYEDLKIGRALNTNQEQAKNYMNQKSQIEDIQNNNDDNSISQIMENTISRINQNDVDNLQELDQGIQQKGKKLNEMIYDLKKQIEIIQKFRQKEFNILISTNVTEEGFNIPDCKYVIAYDQITSIREYIQCKGRARQENSFFVLMTQNENFTKTSLQIYDRSLMLIKQYAKEYSDKNFDELEQEHNMLINERNLINQRGQAQQQELYYERTLVAQTSLINTNWSNNLLINFVNYIQGEQTGIKNEYFIRGPLFYYVQYAGIGYVCYIVLPKFATKRYFFGELKNTKYDAQRSATYKAVCELRKNQELDENLNSLKSRLLFIQYQNQDWKEDLNDPIYKQIVEETVIVREEFINNEEGKEPIRVGRKRYFQSYINQAFDIKFMAGITLGQFKKQKTQTFTLYAFKFKYNNQDFSNFNDLNNQEVGFLHIHQNKPETYKHLIEKTGNIIEMQPIRQIELTFEQYEKLKLIHQFIVSGVRNWDIQFYSFLTGEKIKENGQLNQNKNDVDFLTIDNQQFTAIMVLLFMKDDYLEIDYEKYEPIEQYMNYMKNIFKYANNINDYKSQLQQQQNFLQQKQQGETSEKVKWSKNYRHRQHFELMDGLDENQKKSILNNYIVQNISDNMFLGKFILNGLVQNQQDLPQQDLNIGSQAVQKQIKTDFKRDQDLNKRLQTLQKQIRADFNQDRYIMSAQVLHKYLKGMFQQYQGEQISQSLKDKQKYGYYQSEWAKYPLNIETYFKLRILIYLVMPKVRDFFLSLHFKYHILSNLLNNRMNVINNRIYELNMLKTIIFEQEVEFLHYLSQPLYKENNSYIKQLQKNIQPNNYYSYRRNQIIQVQQENNQEHLDFKQLIQQIPTQLIFKSMSTSSYGSEFENYEQLEILGDAVLKLLASLQVFIQHQFVMEGELHIRRSRIISNQNLRQIAIKNKFFHYIMSVNFPYNAPEFILDKFKIEELIEEQSYIQDIVEQNSKQIKRQRIMDEKYQQEKINRMTSKIKYQNHHLIDLPDDYQYIPEKVHADIIESLIGACFQQHRSIEVCQIFIHSLGILELPSISQYMILNTEQPKFDPNGLLWQNFNIVEEILGYKFNNRNYLLQALSHLSFYNQLDRYKASKDVQLQQSTLQQQLMRTDKMSLRDIITASKQNTQKIDQEVIKQLNEMGSNPFLSYERLEYLGDAVLDCVVIEWLVQKYPLDSPGDLSLKKQSIVCNKALALVTINYDLDKFILHENLHDNYAKILERIRNDYKKYYNNINEIYEKEGMIKILGDIFESLIGAIYIDSNLNYETIKSVILQLMEKKFMEHFCSPNQLLNHPQDKLSAFLKKNNYESAQIIFLEEEPKNGQYKFALVETSTYNDKILFEVWASSEKEAYDLIFEQISKKTIQINT